MLTSTDDISSVIQGTIQQQMRTLYDKYLVCLIGIQTECKDCKNLAKHSQWKTHCECLAKFFRFQVNFLLHVRPMKEQSRWSFLNVGLSRPLLELIGSFFLVHLINLTTVNDDRKQERRRRRGLHCSITHYLKKPDTQ